MGDKRIVARREKFPFALGVRAVLSSISFGFRDSCLALPGIHQVVWLDVSPCFRFDPGVAEG